MTLHRDGEGEFRVHSSKTQRTMVFAAARAGGPAQLRSIRDAWDNAITLDYEGERLHSTIDPATGRRRGLRSAIASLRSNRRRSEGIDTRQAA